MTVRWLTILTLSLPLVHATSFVSINGDPNNFFVPDQLSDVSFPPGSVSTVATLGDGSLGFNGGLTVGSGGVLYAIANDSSGAGSLYTVQSNGTTTLVGSAGGLGSGFLGGLTWDSANSTLYAAVLDPLGNTTLSSITGGGVPTSTGLALGTGFSGLAYDSANGLFFGIGNDNTGFSTLYDFSLGGPATAVGALGFGYGALTYDAANDVFWAIDPVNNAGSQLIQVSSAGVASAPSFTLGDGFVELAVTQAPFAGTPEPAGVVMLGTGLVLIGFLRRRK